MDNSLTMQTHINMHKEPSEIASEQIATKAS